ncbi:MAG: FKBP-type peptidyl-prolyl cis-trans isomerase [Candidatus Eisenbacteria bacterium]|nr:FKBP-type peptidyl-prolyl cis-trans isomerase [Candidatus Eisenbacteria bacterium]
MRRVLVVVAVLAVALALTSCGKGIAPKKQLSTFDERSSYAIGLNVGASLKATNMPIDVAAFVQGLRDTLEGGKPLMTSEEVMTVMQEFSQKARDAELKKRDEAAATNLDAGRAFLEANKAKDGIVTTASGLQYEVLTQGGGAKPKATDRVSVHYRGTLIDGTEFDSSYAQGQPAQFQLDAVIPGWTEALQLMPVGSKYRIFLPPDLAYGERGAGGRIGPNSALIFEVELLSIEK